MQLTPSRKKIHIFYLELLVLMDPWDVGKIGTLTCYVTHSCLDKE